MIDVNKSGNIHVVEFYVNFDLTLIQLRFSSYPTVEGGGPQWPKDDKTAYIPAVYGPIFKISLPAESLCKSSLIFIQQKNSYRSLAARGRRSDKRKSVASNFFSKKSKISIFYLQT